MLLIGTLSVAAVGLGSLMLRLVYIRWKYRHIPSPKTRSFILGHLYEISKEKAKSRGDHPIDSLMMKWHSEVGSIFVLYTFVDAIVILLNPADIQTVFMNPVLQKSHKQTTTFSTVLGERFIGNGVLCMYNNAQWRQTRQLYDHAFQQDFVRGLFPKLCECANEFLAKLMPLADGNTKVPMKKHIYVAAMSIITKVLYSLDFESVWKGRSLGMKHKYKKDTDINSLWNYAYVGGAIGANNPLYKYLHPFETRSYCEVARTLRMIGQECVEQRIKNMQAGKELPNDLLTCVLKLASNAQAADLESLVDNFINLHGGGGEPSASALSFAVVLVSQHPDVLQQLLTEIDQVVGKKKEITFDDLSKLQYTEQVIHETLRMYGPATPFGKEAPAGGITLSGYNISAGTILSAVHVGIMCQMSQYFEDPYTFKPSRFNPNNQKPSPYVFYPFGIGERMCAGKFFAMVLMKLFLVRLVQTYEVTLPDEYKLEVEHKLLKRTADDIMCTIQQRK
ncbi:hypothetical protein EMCRGX_G023087 [Ephydatia muelleri]